MEQPATIAVEKAARPQAGAWPKIRYQLYRSMVGVWKFLAGAALTQSLLGAVAVAGWTQRAAQRAVQMAWWKRVGKEACFCDFVQCSTYHRALGGWPNWVLEHDRAWMRAHRAPGMAKFRTAAKALFHSLRLNLKLGAQTIFNTGVFTLPGCVLMLFSWYAGWHNSFNKGYEQAAVGLVLGLSGIALFIAAMYYVPMAQMRQASTGNWRAFYQFKTVWQLVRKKWLACFLLAVAFTAFSLPVTILKTLPASFAKNDFGLGELPPTEALKFAKAYYFFAAFVFLAAYVALRMIAARIYASALLDSVQSGALTEDSLAENEWETLHRLGLLEVRPAPARHKLIRTAAWLGTRMGRAVTGVALFLVWFSFAAQIYVSEFFLKSPHGRGWLNQPLVQVPWFNYIPSALKEAAKAPEARPSSATTGAVEPSQKN